VRPAPRCDPPFDDELDPQVWAGPHQLALDWSGGRAVSAPHRPSWPETAAPREEVTARGRGVAPAVHGEATTAGRGAAPGMHGAATEPGWGAAPVTPPAGAHPGAVPVAGASGDAKLAVRRFVHMCVEVLNGYRPAAHLRRLALPKEAAGVVAQAAAGTSRMAELRCEARPGRRRDGRPGPADRRPGPRDRRRSPVGVLGLRLCEPRPGAVEAAVLLVTGERTWAMALRLELHQQSWCATTLRLL
jgi:hypothetical protein